MRAALVGLVIVLCLAAPVSAHEDEEHGTLEGPAGIDTTAAHEDDGVEPVQFVALLVAGCALMTAVTALVVGPRRLPT